MVIDVAGPVPLVVEGARLRALAGGAPPPLPHEDPDIRAQVAAVTGDFTLEPGGPDADLTVTLKTPDLAAARAAAEAIAARLAPRLRRGIAIRIQRRITATSAPRSAPRARHATASRRSLVRLVRFVPKLGPCPVRAA